MLGLLSEILDLIVGIEAETLYGAPCFSVGRWVLGSDFK